MSFQGLAHSIGTSIRRLIKGTLLIIWIGFLVNMAGLAATGKVSKSVVDYFKPIQFEYDFFYSDVQKTPLSFLEDYLRNYDNPPPLESVLDIVVTRPAWNMRNIAAEFSGYKTPEQLAELIDYEKSNYYADLNEWMREQYYSLFRKIEGNLIALVEDNSIVPDSARHITITMPEMSKIFRSDTTGNETASNSIELPLLAINWITSERERRKLQKDRNALIDTFFLLIVLGAFGSLIFLTRDYISQERDTPLAAYVFRPILGMFLAMAIFVVDVLAHAFVSTASILEIRNETLYLLALAGGLLSEQTYTVVSIRAQAALDKLKAKVAKENVDAEAIRPSTLEKPREETRQGESYVG